MANKRINYLDFEAIENKTTGTHSFYSRAVSKGTIGLLQLLNDALTNTGVDPMYALMIYYKINREVLRKLRMGIRCDLDGMMTLSPGFRLSVKDTVDGDGNVIPAKPEDMNPQDGESYISVELNKDFVKKFADETYWRRLKPTPKKKK